MEKKGIRLASAVFALGVAMSLCATLAYGVRAFAAPPASVAELPAAAEQTHAPVSSILQNTGSLTVHKYTPATSDLSAGDNDGMTKTTTDWSFKGAYPIKGVKFTVQKIKEIDLKTNDGWEKAAQLAQKMKDAPSENTITTNSYHLDNMSSGNKTMSTMEDGSAKFDSLPVGLYFVRETNDPDDSVTIMDGSNSGRGKSTVAAALVPSLPFIIAVPLTNPTNHNQWVYDVNVYPKNAVVSIEKSVADSQTPGAGNISGSAGNDSIISYTVTTDIPQAVKEITNYQIIDPLDARLHYEEHHSYSGSNNTGDVELKLVKANDEAVSDQTLLKDTDYQVQVHTENKLTTSSTSEPQIGEYVTINFTDMGRKKLVTARDSNMAAKVVWTLYVKLNKLNEVYSEIPNQAYLIPSVPNKPSNMWDGNNGPKPDTPKNPNIPGVPSNKVVSKYGSVKLTKKSAKDDSTLNDAKFKLYLCDADSQLTKFDGNSLEKDSNYWKQNDLNTYAISVDGKNEWSTQSNGTFTIQGLQLNDFKNNSESYMSGRQSQQWKDNHFYCFVETQAPVGYELNPEPIKFQITTDNKSAAVAIEVKDAPTNGGFNLPKTGAQGVAVILLAGVFLIAGSMTYMILAAKKRKEQEQSL